MNLQDYEISLWGYKTQNDTFQEYKIAVIGGSNIDSNSKLHEPVLVKKINGENSFSFVLYTKYFDNVSGQLVDNPFIGLLQNQARIKVRDGEDWYDFVVSDTQLSIDKKTITYKCDDAFAYELGKAGYELEFEDDLLTNQNTAQVLASMVLQGTNWIVDNSSDIINQWKEDNLIEFHLLTGDATFTPLLDGDDIIIHGGDNGYFYGFYSEQDMAAALRQFIVFDGGSQIKSGNSIILDNFEYPTYHTSLATLGSGVFTTYKGAKLVENSIQSNYDRRLGTYVNDCTIIGDATPYKVFKITEYITPTLVSNYIDVSGFEGRETGSIASPVMATKVQKSYYPPITSDTFGNDRKVYYEWDGTDSNKCVYYNLNANKKLFKQFDANTSYIFGLSLLDVDSGSPSDYTISIIDFDRENPVVLFSNNENTIQYNGTYYYQLVLQNGAEKSFEDIEDIAQLKLCVECVDDISNIEKVEFYPYYPYAESPYFIQPTTQIDDVEIITKYNVFDAAATYTSIDDLVILEVLDEEDFFDKYEYTQRAHIYEKVRSIQGSKSNRFNLLQTICERFECWMHFNIERDSNGKVLSKKIKFTQRQGDKLPYGFIDGINLSDANKTTNSSNLVSKLIVSPNANEFATNGSCNISLAKDNFTKESTLFNFDYYLTKNLLDKDTFATDFYDAQNGWLIRLKNLNDAREVYIEKLTNWYKSLDDVNADIFLAEAGIVSSDEEMNKWSRYIVNYDGIHNYSYWASHPSEIISEQLRQYIYSYEEARINYTKYTSMNTAAVDKKVVIEEAIQDINDELTSIASEKQSIYTAIYTKYYPYIQEGTWINEEYIDENLYYLDAVNTLYVSAFPKVSYSLKVVDLSCLPDFTQYKFKPGDITYVQSTDFFGWNDDGITPFKTPIYISEIKKNLEDPSVNTITVQNYESDFDSLFQRIAATTQTLQYKEGIYNKTSEIITSNGNVTYGSIAEALNDNKLALTNLGAQSVDISETGITATDTLNPNKKVRIVGSGVYISNDNGETYKSAISGNGINTEYLAAGQIDANNINLVDGNCAAFRWDRSGINAYKVVEGQNVRSYDVSKAVRFDRFGIYSFDNNEEYLPHSVDEIWEDDNVIFQLTEKGLKFNQGRSEQGTEVGRIELGFVDSEDEKKQVIAAGIPDDNNELPFRVYDNGEFYANEGTIGSNVKINGSLSINNVDTEQGSLGSYFRVIPDGDKVVIELGGSDNSVILKQYNDHIGFYTPTGDVLFELRPDGFKITTLTQLELGDFIIKPNEKGQLLFT